MKCIIMMLVCYDPMDAPCYLKQILGLLSGSGTGTELMILSHNPRPGAIMSDAKNFGVFGLLIFLVIVNIAYI